MDMTLVFLLLSCFAASIVQAVSGLGYTIVMMGLAPLFLPYRTANLVTLVSAIAVLAAAIWSLRQHINYRLLALPVLFSLVARFISLQLMAVLPETFLLRFSGIFLIAIALYLALLSQRIHIRPTRLNGSVIGFMAGLFGGLTNISGPIFVMYYLPACETKESYSATLQLSFLVGCLFTLTLNGFRGSLTAEVWKYGLLGACGALSGVWLGLKIFRRIKRDLLRKILCLLIAVMGVMQLL